MQINLVILQPPGYIHSLCFLDTARYLRYHLRKQGIQATISKNRLAPQRLNIIFGGHLGVPKSWMGRTDCIWFNQEQVGHGGAPLPADYMEVLANAHVIDYDPANLDAYPSARLAHADSKPRLRLVVPLSDAPFLREPDGGIELRERPIDLLFFGSINDERKAVLDRIERCGVAVARFDHPMYGPERDAYIAQSKAVLNLPFYSTNRLEQVRIFNSLSIGTPVVSLRRPGLVVNPAYDRSVHWFDESNVEDYFSAVFGTQTWYADCEEQLEHWRMQDPGPDMQTLALALRGLTHQGALSCPPQASQAITHLNLTADRHYRHDWFNVSAQCPGDSDAPLDLAAVVLDGEALQISINEDAQSIAAGQLKAILAEDDWTDPSRLRRLLGNAATLLEDQGVLILSGPLGVFGDDPPLLDWMQQCALGRIRGALEEELACGQSPRVLELIDAQAVQDPSLTGQGARQTLRVQLRCRECTPRERVLRRCERLDFGSFPEDATGVEQPA